MSFLVFIIIMTIWLSGLRSKKAEFAGDWTGRYPLDCFDYCSICSAKKPHYNLQNCSMSYVPVCCKTLVLGRKGAAFNLSEKSHCVGDIVKMGNDAFVNFF